MIEVQFQKNEKFYLEFLAEIFLYLNQSEIIEDWKAIAIFAKRSLEPKVPTHVQDLIASDWILRVYLEDWLDRETDSFGIGIVQLILAPRTKTKALIEKLRSKVEQETDANLRNQVVKFVETVLVYKFPKLSRQEIENMFTLSDLKNTRVYKDAKQEGVEEGIEIGEERGIEIGEERGIEIGEERGIKIGKVRGIEIGKVRGIEIGKERGIEIGEERGEASMLKRMLSQKFGNLSPNINDQINNLNRAQLESMSEIIFGLENLSQLQDWLEDNS